MTDSSFPSSYCNSSIEEDDQEQQSKYVSKSGSPEKTGKHPALTEAFDENVRPFIDLIDKLRMIGLEDDISLPTVVVIGDQSSGKSSVLEAISGIQLPRGSGIMTRCPLELKMKTSPNWSARIQYTTIHGERIEQDVETPECIDKEIRVAQTAMTKNSKDVSEELISLDVNGQNVPNLSIVDLPGIARIAVEGQSKDVCQRIKDMIYKYACKENTVMLCVIPCNQDVATIESLHIAREVDPEGRRTLGVLTKPDLVDKGMENDVLKLLSNKVYPLQKGYSILKCRSQQDIDNGISVNNAKYNEEYFFENHEHFKEAYVEGMAGVDNLANKLTIELVGHIKANIPAVRQQIQSELKDVQTRYEHFGKDPPATDAEKHMYMIEVGNRIARNFEDLSKGIYSDPSLPSHHRMYAVVYQSFEELNDVIQNHRPNECDAELLDQIKYELHLQRGVELPPFLSYNVCKHFILIFLKKVKSDISMTINSSADTIFETASYLIEEHTHGYSELRCAYTFEMQAIHGEMMNNCKQAINVLLEQEDFPFTMDQAYFNFTEMEKTDIHAAVQNYQDRVFCEVHKDDALQLDSKMDIAPVKKIRTKSKRFDPFFGERINRESELSEEDVENLRPASHNRPHIENSSRVCKPKDCLKCIKSKEKMKSRENVMAENLSNYMNVAFTRLMDNIAMTILYHFFRQFSKQLNLAFAKFATNPANCNLIAEEKSREKERKKLKSKIERLQKGLIEIGNI